MNPLSRRLACLLLVLQCASPARAAEDGVEAWRALTNRWKQALSKEKKDTQDALDLESSTKEMRAWLASGTTSSGLESHARESYYFTTFDFLLAKAWADADDHKKSLRYLKAQAGQPGIFLQETRNPNWFAVDVFRLHVKIMATTGKVADIPYSGYQVFACPSSEGRSRYAFVWEPEGTDDRGILVEGVADGEQRHEITFFEYSREDGCRSLGRAQVVSKRGKLQASIAERPGGTILILKGISKVLEFKGEFEVPFVHPTPRSQFELRLDQDKLEQPLDAIARMQQSQAAPKEGVAPETTR